MCDGARPCNPPSRNSAGTPIGKVVSRCIAAGGPRVRLRAVIPGCVPARGTPNALQHICAI
jgi:hypothetical protein